MVDQLNRLNKNVWAILLVILGAGMAWASTFNKDLLQPALLIIGGGLAIFEGRSAAAESAPAAASSAPAPAGAADNPDAK